MKRNAIIVLIGFCLGAGLDFICEHRPSAANISRKPEAIANRENISTDIATSVLVRNWSWADLDDQDYRALIANLSMVGCPPETINAIVRPRIQRHYSRLMLRNPMSKYWEKPDEQKERLESIDKLRSEMNQLLADLGFKVPQARSKPVVSLFPPEKMAKIAEITAQYPQRPIPLGATAQEYADSFANRRARLDYLAQYLTPDELYQYRLTMDSNVKTVAQLFRVIDATPDQVKQAAFIFDFTPAAIVNGKYSSDVEQALLSVLGQQKDDELHEAFSPENSSFSSFIMSTDVSQDQIAQLNQLRHQGLDPAALRNAVDEILGPRLGMYYLNAVKPIN
jgi:hypothetical protein